MNKRLTMETQTASQRKPKRQKTISYTDSMSSSIFVFYDLMILCGLGETSWKENAKNVEWKNDRCYDLAHNFYLALEEFECQTQTFDKQNGEGEKQNGSREDKQNGSKKPEDGPFPTLPFFLLVKIAEYADFSSCKWFWYLETLDSEIRKS